MVTIAEDIFRVVEAEVMLLNGEIVRRAFHLERTIKERCCEYSKNHDEFPRLLDRYIQAKRIANTARRRQLRLSASTNSKQMWIDTLRHEARVRYAQECREYRDKLRADVRIIWPCPECIEKHNPTGRRAWWD